MNQFMRAPALFAAAVLVTAAGPPATPTMDHAETLFGMTFDDRYFWMEAGGPTFYDWMSTQNGYTRHVLDEIPERAKLLAQLHKLNSGETRMGPVVLTSGHWIYSKIGATDSTSRILVRATAGGAERVLIDPSEFNARGLAAHIDYWRVSPDARYIAYGVSLGGAETGTLRIRDIESGADLPDRMDRTRYASPSWVDHGSFLYTRLPAPAPGQTQPLTGTQVYFHRLGSDPATDVLVFGPGNVAGLDAGSNFVFRAIASPDSAVIVGIFDTDLSSSPKAVFVSAKADLASALIWRKVAGLEDDVRGVALHGDTLYLRTARDAPGQRVIRTSASAPDLLHAQTVVAEGIATIDGMAAAADALYVWRNEGGVGQLVRVPWDGVAESITTPFKGSIDGLTADRTVAGMVLRMQSWTHSETVFDYDPDAREFINTLIAPPSPVSFDDIDWNEVRAPAADGSMVPVSIIARHAALRDGHHPVLMFAYGAYGVTIAPAFNAMRRAWFDRGGIYVVVHVRGSGGFGDEWYRAGRLGQKPNSVTDFIDSAAYLEGTGWTTSGMLGAVGGSAGGIVIGGAIAARPELFAGAVVAVGLVNPLRLEQIPIGPFNTGEFGSTQTEEGTRMLAAIDPYYQLIDGTSYPGVMVATGLNDARVPPWMPGKFVARLQVATAGPRPVLFRVDQQGGHAAETKEQQEVDLADTYAFLLWQAGVPEFQPTP